MKTSRPKPARANSGSKVMMSASQVRVTLGLICALSIAAPATSAWAESVPLPKPVPKARDNSQQVAASDTRLPNRPAPQAAPAAPVVTQPPPSPFLPDLKKLFSLPNSNASLDANQRILANKVSAYLSTLQNVSGNFVQVGPDGSKSTGDFYIQKPGKVRFEYDDPSPIAIVADGTTVVVRDRRLATQDNYPLSQTPLRFLLSDRIDLLKDTNLVNVSADDVYVSVTIEEKQPLIGTSRLMLMIGAKDNQLKQWTVTDPQGYDTTVAVYNLNTSKKLDPSMFKIDFTNYQVTPN